MLSVVVVLVVTLCDPMDYSPPGSSVHGILQARLLELVAIPFSRGPSWLRKRTWVSCTADRFFTEGARREARVRCYKWFIYRGGVNPSYVSVPYWILYHSKYLFFLFFFAFLEVALIPSFSPALKTGQTLAYRNPSLRISFLSHHACFISPSHCSNVYKALPTDIGESEHLYHQIFIIWVPAVT